MAILRDDVASQLKFDMYSTIIERNALPLQLPVREVLLTSSQREKSVTSLGYSIK